MSLSCDGALGVCLISKGVCVKWDPHEGQDPELPSRILQRDGQTNSKSKQRQVLPQEILKCSEFLWLCVFQFITTTLGGRIMVWHP